MSDLLRAAICVALIGGLGAVMGRVLRRGGAERRGGFGWSMLLGAAVAGLALQIPPAIDGRISHLSFALMAFLGLVASGQWLVASGQWLVASLRCRRDNRSTLGGTNCNPVASRLGWLADLPWPGKIVAAVLIGAAVYHAATADITGYDGRTIFALKARILYDTGTVRGEDFQDVQRVNFNPHYPLLLSLLESQLYWTQGGVTGHGLILLLLVFPLATASIFAAEVRRFDNVRIAALAALLLLLAPIMLSCYEGAALSGSADVAVAAFFFAGACEVARWLEQPGWRPAVSAGLLLGAAATTKAEGLLVCTAACAAALAIGWTVKRIRPAGRAWPSAIVGCGLVIAAAGLDLMIHRGMPRSPYYPSYLTAALDGQWLKQLADRPWQVLTFAVQQIVHSADWNLAWLSILMALVCLRRGRLPGRIWFWRLTVVGVVALDLAAMTITPMHLEYELRTTFYRLLLHAYPLAMLVGCEQLAAAGWTRSFASVWWPDVKQYRVDPPAAIQRVPQPTARAA